MSSDGNDRILRPSRWTLISSNVNPVSSSNTSILATTL